MATVIHIPNKPRPNGQIAPMLSTDAAAREFVKKNAVEYPTLAEAREAVRRMAV